MSKVLTPLDLRYLDGDRWLLLTSFACVSDVLGRIDIPAGFITDFNSTPRALWNLIPPTEFGEAAVAHDFLYQRGKLTGVTIDRLTADQVHREFVAWAGGPNDPRSADTPPRQPAARWKRDAFFYGLRAAGWWTWSHYRQNDAVRAALR